MNKKIYKYTRVSTTEQNEARQVGGLEKYEGETFVDKVSGKVAFADRPEGKKIIQAVKDGLISDLIVLEVDRLGRDIIDVLAVLKFMKENEVCVTVHSLGLKSLIDEKSNQTFDLITTVLAQVAQMEYERIKERQREGIAKAKERGVYKGRVKGSKNKDSISLVTKYPNVAACLEAKMSINKTVAATGVGRSTVKRVRKEYFAQS
ncbi:recombinase family protein [Marinifilum caeruleilacunae]|uniref:Recombinase family protein n=1 Tax=Marinifilum caeruleilacunae TaxID=2499076 RepID=A0ABX1X2A6_9BACT|nr:recombinase family protein [Marinifilum caeruleilacunae]NOU62225.1 recombinase family protein [Marinifilum caeruleilacunae]